MSLRGREDWRSLLGLLSLRELGRTGTVIGVSLVLVIGTGLMVGIAAVGSGPTSDTASVGVALHPGWHLQSSGPGDAKKDTATIPSTAAVPGSSTTLPTSPSTLVVPTTVAPPASPSPPTTTVPVSPAVAAAVPPPQTPPPFTWSEPVTLSGLGGYLSGIDCPSPSMCLATDTAGDVASSTDPAGGPGAWNVANIAGHSSLGTPSCPTTSLCVVADQDGVAVSSDPTAGAAAWSQTDLGGTGAVSWSGVSCASPILCVAVGKAAIATSVDPQSGNWTVVPAPNDSDFAKPDPLSSVSCPTSTFCVAAGALGMAYVSTNPTAGTGSWKGTKTDYFAAQICQQCTNLTNSLVGISCPTPALCVAIDPIGDVVTSTDPGGPVPNWTLTAVNAQWIPLNFVSCLSTTFCFAGAHFSSTPGTGSWTSAGYRYEAAVSCPLVVACVAVAGDQVTMGAFTG